MKILVTGSEGNIGSELVPYLQSKGHEVLCIDIVQKYRPNYILCDILNLSDAEAEISEFKPEAVFHMAAMVSRITCEKSPFMAVTTNVSGTMNIANLCRRHKCQFINFSTSEVYGNIGVSLDETVDPQPNNVYGTTKLMAEWIAEYFSKGCYSYINLRPFMMYSENELMGENRSAMIRFAENIWLNKPITVHKGAVRSWLHVFDAVVLLEKMLYLKGNHVLNMGNSHFINIEYMANFMCEYAARSKDLIKIENLPEKMTLKKIASFRKQQELLNYTPQVGQEEGIKRVMDVVKKRLGV